MQHFPPHMQKSSASAISLLHKSKIYCVNKSSGDRNTARFFFLFSVRWLEKRDSWSSGPDSTSQTVSCPNKQSLKTAQTSMVRSSCGRNTHPRCKPTLALLSSSRLRLQFVAHYFIHPESEQRIPDSLQAPDNTPHFLYGQCVQSSLCPVYRQKVSSAIHLFLTHALVLPSLRGHNKHISLSANTTAVKLSLVRQNLLNGPTFQKRPF